MYSCRNVSFPDTSESTSSCKRVKRSIGNRSELTRRERNFQVWFYFSELLFLFIYFESNVMLCRVHTFFRKYVISQWHRGQSIISRSPPRTPYRGDLKDLSLTTFFQSLKMSFKITWLVYRQDQYLFELSHTLRRGNAAYHERIREQNTPRELNYSCWHFFTCTILSIDISKRCERSCSARLLKVRTLWEPEEIWRSLTRVSTDDMELCDGFGIICTESERASGQAERGG